jgi:hypothetical protein
VTTIVVTEKVEVVEKIESMIESATTVWSRIACLPAGAGFLEALSILSCGLFTVRGASLIVAVSPDRLKIHGCAGIIEGCLLNERIRDRRQEEVGRYLLTEGVR